MGDILDADDTLELAGEDTEEDNLVEGLADGNQELFGVGHRRLDILAVAVWPVLGQLEELQMTSCG